MGAAVGVAAGAGATTASATPNEAGAGIVVGDASAVVVASGATSANSSAWSAAAVATPSTKAAPAAVNRAARINRHNVCGPVPGSDNGLVGVREAIMAFAPLAVNAC